MSLVRLPRLSFYRRPIQSADRPPARHKTNSYASRSMFRVCTLPFWKDPRSSCNGILKRPRRRCEKDKSPDGWLTGESSRLVSQVTIATGTDKRDPDSERQDFSFSPFFLVPVSSSPCRLLILLPRFYPTNCSLLSIQNPMPSLNSNNTMTMKKKKILAPLH